MKSPLTSDAQALAAVRSSRSPQCSTGEVVTSVTPFGQSNPSPHVSHRSSKSLQFLARVWCRCRCDNSATRSREFENFVKIPTRYRARATCDIGEWQWDLQRNTVAESARLCAGIESAIEAEQRSGRAACNRHVGRLEPLGRVAAREVAVQDELEPGVIRRRGRERGRE